MKKTVFGPVCVFIACSFNFSFAYGDTISVGSQPVFAALSEGVRQDPRVQSAVELGNAKRLGVNMARAGYLPVLRGNGSVGSTKSNDPLVRDGSKRTFGLELEQPIPVFGREAAKVAEAESAVSVQSAEVRLVEQIVLSEILDALVAAETAERVWALRGQLTENLANQVKFTRLAVADGGLKATEERLLASHAAQAGALRSMSQADRAAAQLRLKRLLPGVAQAPAVAALNMPGWWTGPQTLEALEAAAVEKSPALLKAQAEADRAQAELDTAEADKLPRLSLNLQGTRGKFGDASADAHAVFVGLSVPLFEGGAPTSRAQAAAHRLAAAQAQAEFETRLARERVAEAWLRWQSANEVVAAWDKVESEEAASVALAKEQVAKGGATVIGLLKTQESQLEAGIQAATARAQRDGAWVKLMLESGTLAALMQSAAAE